MSEQMSNTMVPVGTKGEYEVYQVMPCSIEDAAQMEAEVSTHYKHDTQGIYDSNDDVDTSFVRVGGRWYEYVDFGKDNLTPYRNQQLIEDNMVMSQCQNFNILTCYGQGLRFLDRDTGEKAEDRDIRSFCLRNALHLQWLRMSTDMKYHYFSVMVINLSRDHTKIVKVSMRNACDCRFTKRNSFGCIEHVLVGDFREGRTQTIEAIPLLDEIDPLGDLEYRMGKGPHLYTSQIIDEPPMGKQCKFAILCLFPTPGYRYYPVPYFASIYRDAWYDIYRLIGIGKRFMIKNTSAPRIQVEVHRTYWDNVCKEENITDKTGRLVAIKNVTNQNDLMIINKSGIVIRMAVADCRVMGRATQGVRLINLTKKNDVIASVCKVMSSELEAIVEQKSREEWAQNSEAIRRDVTSADASSDNADEPILDVIDEDENLVDFDDTEEQEELTE